MKRSLVARFAVSLALLGALAAVAGCGNSHGEPREVGSAIRVRTLVVAARPEPSRLELAGELRAEERIEIASKVAGRIAELPVTEGTAVRRGDLLARIDAPELVSALAQARAAQEAARRNLETSARQAERFRRLAASEVVTPRDLELAETAEAGARAAHEQARAMTEMSERNLAYAVLRAPRDGVVVRRRARAGDLATPGRVLLVLEDPSRKEVRVTLPAAAGFPVTAGGRAEVVADGRTPVPATVDRVTPGADRYTLEAYLRADGLDAPSGTFVRAVLFGPESTDAVRVPETALIRRGPLTGVFTVREGRAALRWLRLSPDGRVQAGLSPGDSVILAPPADLQDGDLVESAS